MYTGKRSAHARKTAAYSILLVFSLFFTFVLGVVGTNNPVLSFVLDAIIVPAEATLMALLAVTLVYASARLLRRRVDVMSFIFLGICYHRPFIGHSPALYWQNSGN